MKLEFRVKQETGEDDSSSTDLSSSITIPTFNSGISVPTRTTATLTPTTLRNIEQEISNYDNVPFQAGFVPPPVNTSYTTSLSGGGTDPEQSMDSSDMMTTSSDSDSLPPPVTVEDIGRENATKTSYGKKSNGRSKKNKGGRRPNKTSNLTPEEEEKRRVRRERNKLAAARCRRRREDRTKELTTETDHLEAKKRALQAEVQELEREKEDLEFLLESHRSTCKQLVRSTSPIDIKPDIANTLLSLADRIKSEPIHPPSDTENDENEQADEDDDIEDDDDRSSSPKKVLLTSAAIDPLPIISREIPVPNKMNRPNRPNTLGIPLISTPSQALNTIPINTPSNGIFNFESLMEGGTGLTPVQPKNIGDPVRSGLDLITPTSEQGTKLV